VPHATPDGFNETGLYQWVNEKSVRERAQGSHRVSVGGHCSCHVVGLLRDQCQVRGGMSQRTCRKGPVNVPVRCHPGGSVRTMVRTTPIFRLNRVTADPATMNTVMIIQFRAVGLKRSPSRSKTIRIPTDIPPRILKAASPARRQNLKRPPRDPSPKKVKVMRVRTVSAAPLTLMTLIIATQAANQISAGLFRARRVPRR